MNTPKGTYTFHGNGTHMGPCGGGARVLLQMVSSHLCLVDHDEEYCVWSLRKQILPLSDKQHQRTNEGIEDCSRSTPKTLKHDGENVRRGTAKFQIGR